MHWKIILILIAGTCFCASSAAYLFVKICLRPKEGGDWEHTNWDFEDYHPAIRRYDFWNRITLTAVILSMLLLFVVIVV